MSRPEAARTKLQWFTALRGADLTNAEFRVAVILATFTDASMGNAFPGWTKLSAASAVTENTAKNAIKSLQRKGWVRLTEVGGNQIGKGRANVYAVCFPDDKGVTQCPPSRRPKGVTQRPPLSRDVTEGNGAAEGGQSAEEGGQSTTSEGGHSLTPHQVLTTSGHQKHQVLSSSHLSNARESDAIGDKNGEEMSLSRIDQQLPGGFRKGERARARELLDDGVPVTRILYKHLIPERNVRPARTYPTAQEAQR